VYLYPSLALNSFNHVPLKIISSGAQYVTLQKCFHIQVWLFGTPPIKTERGTLKTSETTNSKPPGPIIMMTQSETLIGSQVIFITLFSAGARRCSSAIYWCNYAKPKRFCWAKQAYFDISSSNFIVHDDYILSRTAGDALEYINFKYPISILLYFFTSVCLFVIGDFLFQFLWVKKIGQFCQRNSKFILKLLW
jgi:hypothetical protein